MRPLALTFLLILAGCCPFKQIGLAQPALPERSGIVTLKGTPLTLLGPALQVGDPAPGFTAVDGNFQQISLDDFTGKAVLISAVPSLDTPVCSSQTRRFNKEMSKIDPAKSAIVTISMDLPFAQNRFCEVHDIERIQVLSDCAGREFGQRYGVLIKERGLLARSIFVIGKDGGLAYLQIVPELSQYPDYSAALEALQQAAYQ